MLLRLLASGWLVSSLVLAAPAGPALTFPAGVWRAATADETALLTEALEKTARDLPRWAYTETRVVRDEKGRIKTNVVIRYDPSKPYAEQWQPLSINGKAPSPGDLAKYRRQGERAGRRAGNPASDQRRSLGEVIETSRARVVEENDQDLVFELPLRKDRNERFPPEKFQVMARIKKTPRAVENIFIRLREAFRAKLLLKIKSGEGTLDFTPVDPPHPPTLTAVRGDASASILFISVGGELDLRRTDFKHVRPYDERFEVQIGTLKAIDF